MHDENCSASSTDTCKHHSERKRFTEAEDQKLQMLVKMFGETNWPMIAKLMNFRTTRQCRERYKTYLSPHINNSPWTNEDDEKLIYLVHQIGPKWAKIAKMFNGRSDNNVKNRWYTYLKSREGSPYCCFDSPIQEETPYVPEKAITFKESEPAQKQESEPKQQKEEDLYFDFSSDADQLSEPTVEWTVY